jgi:outer membrane receptor protein involved in Fe transport
LSAKTSVSGKLRLGSNFPIPGYFESTNGGLWVASTRNLVRLPVYARLDLRANHTFNFDRRRLTLFVEVINVLNRDNYAVDNPRVLSTGRVVGATQSLFPFLPSAGLLFDF